MSIRRAQEAVSYVARVNVLSRDRPEIVDAQGLSALEKACARARIVERCDRAVGSAQEAVKYAARVSVISRDRPLQIEG